MEPTDPDTQQQGEREPAKDTTDGAISGRDKAVDHERQPGVPPPSNDDQDDADRTGADSFPASDPPASY